MISLIFCANTAGMIIKLRPQGAGNLGEIYATDWINAFSTGVRAPIADFV